METQNVGVGEVRRIHIIYFLSRKGRVDHPHLIRVHHLTRNGVRLRDVKRWLLELRGKDLAENYAWSYKRRYKSGYVWQDLLDEDLITPLADNEYVLTGSEITSNPVIYDLGSHGEKEALLQKEEPPVNQVHPKAQKFSSDEERPETQVNLSSKTSSELDKESPVFGSETSTFTDWSMNKFREVDDEKNRSPEVTPASDSFYSIMLNKNKTKKSGKEYVKVDQKENNGMGVNSSASKNGTFARSKSYSTAASNIFRNLITCGAVDIKDTAMVMMSRKGRSNNPSNVFADKRNGAEICREEKLGGSERISTLNSRIDQQQQRGDSGRKSWDGNSSKKSESENSNQKTVSAAYKPVNGPNCSQCRKPFKPEKLHAHMKSCRGMMNVVKGAVSAATEKTPQRSTDSPHGDSIASYYLTRN